MLDLKAEERLIVALDVPTREDAMRLVDQLEGVAQFYKIGWELFIAGEWRLLLNDLQGKKIFVDLKVPADIGNTVMRVVEVCSDLGVKFLTLSDSRSLETLRIAKKARGTKLEPKLLSVPYLSSLDESDLQEVSGGAGGSLADYVSRRSKDSLAAGCDGVIVSGREIRVVRELVGKDPIIVSPGIRSEGASTEDHKRSTTPAEAIRMGSDYLVVGRPIRSAPDPRKAAENIIGEIRRGLEQPPSSSNPGPFPSPPIESMRAKSPEG